MAWQRELAVAEAAVLRAAQLTKRVQSSVAAVAKADATPVTAADLAAQALVVAAGAQLIYAEVGGKVTDLDGRPFDFGAGRLLSRNRGLVAAHGDIHHHILALARELADAPDEPPVGGGHL